MNNKQFLIGLVLGTLLTLIVIRGYDFMAEEGVFDSKSNSVSEIPPSSKEANKKVGEIEDLINQRFLKDVDKNDLTEAMYAGVVDGLDDPYSYYFTEEEYRQTMESLSGHYQGIGVILVMEKENSDAVVGHIYEDSPAEKAGIKIGDVVVSVDGEETTGKTLADIGTSIRESEEKIVDLVLRRAGEDELLEISVEKDDIEMSTVAHEMLEDSIGYISIFQFTQATPEQFGEAYEKLQSEGMERLLVDLRDNPGGSLQGVSDTLSVFMPKGLLVYSENRQGERIEFNSDGDNPIEIPMVVLINGNSASASEIFAGAVKDHEIAKLVGTTTFGKGLVQSIFELDDGSAVKLTTSAYFTPNGIDINGKGIVPDVEVENQEPKADETSQEEMTDEQFDKALETLKAITK